MAKKIDAVDRSSSANMSRKKIGIVEDTDVVDKIVGEEDGEDDE